MRSDAPKQLTQSACGFAAAGRDGGFARHAPFDGLLTVGDRAGG
jgi:hypothetical protein